MIEIISRAVIITGTQILCVHRKGKDNIFLPGGHIENGETAPQALKREIKEELGLEADTGGFLGVIEHAYGTGEDTVREINLVFTVENSSLKSEKRLPSSEHHLEFMWVACTEKDLKVRNLQPWVLQTYIPAYAESGTFPQYLSTVR